MKKFPHNIDRLEIRKCAFEMYIATQLDGSRNDLNTLYNMLLKAREEIYQRGKQIEKLNKEIKAMKFAIDAITKERDKLAPEIKLSDI